MTTLVAVYNSDGCVGRCDARCYFAKGKTCNCICGGKNHRAGKTQAMLNVRDGVGLELEYVERFAQAHNFQCDDLTTLDRVMVPNARHARIVARNVITQPMLPLERSPWWKDTANKEGSS